MNAWKTKLRFYFSHPFAWIAAGLLPCICAVIFSLSSGKKLNHLKDQALFLKNKKDWAELKLKKEEAFLTQLKGADRDYVEKELETIQFLSSETQKIHALIHSEPNNENYKKRLEFLQNGENSLRFKEKNFQRLDHFQEVEALAIHPVEMVRGDLSLLLSKIENVPLGDHLPSGNSPDLIIRKFELLKKPLTSNEEHFVVNLELIKRELIE